MVVYQTYPAFLVLEDGTVCQGLSFIDSIISTGEVVFNTGMTGYQEILTDPSYCDQIILFTYPEIGNTGINIEDVESSKSYVRGIIAKNICINPSNWRSKISLVKYLINQQIPHIFSVDTRHIAKSLRERGVMIGCISSFKLSLVNLMKQFKYFKESQNRHLIYRVSTNSLYRWSPNLSQFQLYPIRQAPKAHFLNVVVIDFGVKFNILKRLHAYGCQVTVVPALTSYHSIMSSLPDGILLSNGPGDPALITSVRDTIVKLVNANIPVFGICLGHQLLCLAFGGLTSKLKFGHRGLNHPSGLHDSIKITSQNHGFVVSKNASSMHLTNITDFNLNDKTISGIVHNEKPCFSVQYHPEASPGPHDSDYLFAHFINVMISCKINNW